MHLTIEEFMVDGGNMTDSCSTVGLDTGDKLFLCAHISFPVDRTGHSVMQCNPSESNSRAVWP